MTIEARESARLQTQILASANRRWPLSQAEALVWRGSRSTPRNSDPSTPEPAEPEDCH